ncbi:MAG TPA: hypothetical protein VFG62_03700 [Rhodopila sp.]|nr:hypothetical protein [Rhodopila sp.]
MAKNAVNHFQHDEGRIQGNAKRESLAKIVGCVNVARRPMTMVRVAVVGVTMRMSVVEGMLVGMGVRHRRPSLIRREPKSFACLRSKRGYPGSLLRSAWPRNNAA